MNTTERTKLEFCIEHNGPLPDRDDAPAIAAFKEATGLSWATLAAAYGATERELKGLPPRKPHGHDNLAAAIATHGEPPALIAVEADPDDPEVTFEYKRSGMPTFRNELTDYRNKTGLKLSTIARFYGVKAATVRNWLKVS